MAAGITSDATEIMIYDDTDTSGGRASGPYSFAQIFTALGGTGVDILRVDSGTGVPTYRILKNLQIGDKTVNTATTTLQDTKVVVTFDNQRVLKTRATQPTSWNCILGTKVGTGNEASGKAGCFLFFTNTAGVNNIILRGTVKLYGCTFASTASSGSQALQLPNQTSGASEIVNCNFAGFTGHVLGSAGANLSNIYNLDASADPVGAVITAFFTDNARRITVAGNPGTQFLASATAGIGMKDVQFFGTPLSDLQMSGAGATNWTIVRPFWSQNAQKFSDNGPTTAANGAHEYWIWDVKVVDRDGVGISGIPVTLTDNDGNVQVDTTTTSTGQVSYGSGLTENAVVCADHYALASVYTIHHRGPFTTVVNGGSGKNSNYQTRTFKWNWPGSESVTTTSGTFEDVSDVVPIEDASGGGTSWIELTMP